MLDMPTLPNPRNELLFTSKSVDSNCKEDNNKMLCERCSGEMRRMLAVWRCSKCGFKTDYSGW